MHKIKLLTLTWNACDKLTALKDSLIPAVQNLDWQWVIKDNASKDDTVKYASTWGDRVNCIPYKSNSQNFSQGVNFCFHGSGADDEDYVLLLNNDVIVVEPRSIERMIDMMEKDPEIGVVGGRLLFTNTNKIQHAGVVFHSHMGGPMHFRSNEKDDAQSRKNREFQVVTGAVLLTKAKYFKQAFVSNKSGVIGMDENYHWAFDDVDLCLSIKYSLNKKIVYCGNTEFFHEESASLKKNPVNKLFMNHNFEYLKKKWFGKVKFDSKVYEDNVNEGIYK